MNAHDQPPAPVADFATTQINLSLPWAAFIPSQRVNPCHEKRRLVIHSDGERIIAQVGVDGYQSRTGLTSDEEKDAQTAFIVRACNTHADLVTALQEAHGMIQALTDPRFLREENGPRIQEVLVNNHKALTAALKA